MSLLQKNSMLSLSDYYYILQATTALKKGGIIAYPTEAVFGLGCDPTNFTAVSRLLQLKDRSIDKGLILLASSWRQVKPYIEPLPEGILQKIFATWPGPVTWLLPANAKVPGWIRGEHASVAVRVTSHPLARMLCRFYGKPIVSTSANIASQQPLRCADEIQPLFSGKIDYVLSGAVGNLEKPTEIRDAMTDAVIRH